MKNTQVEIPGVQAKVAQCSRKNCAGGHKYKLRKGRSIVNIQPGDCLQLTIAVEKGYNLHGFQRLKDGTIKELSEKEIMDDPGQKKFEIETTVSRNDHGQLEVPEELSSIWLMRVDYYGVVLVWRAMIAFKQNQVYILQHSMRRTRFMKEESATKPREIVCHDMEDDPALLEFAEALLRKQPKIELISPEEDLHPILEM